MSYDATMVVPDSWEPMYGTRAFNIDAEGYLTGVIYRTRWLPGENIATCRSARRMVTTPYASYTIREPIDDDEPGREIEPGHMLACGPAGGQGMGGCGFHAFLEGSNDYGSAGVRVSGVVALYGRGVRGTRGGRFSKARIVALHVPQRLIPGYTLSDLSKLHAFRHQIFDPSLRPNCCVRPYNQIDPAQLERLRSNYRGIPFYRTFADMVRAHPTTAPHTPEEGQS